MSSTADHAFVERLGWCRPKDEPALAGVLPER